MNTYDLLELIGDTPEEYVLDAGGLGQQTPAKKPMGKKLLLIAAIVAATALLMGSAITRLIALRTEKITVQMPSNGDEQLSGPENTTAATETTSSIPTAYEGERITFDEVHNVFIALPNYYPQQIPDGYTMTFVSNDAPLQERVIYYENAAGHRITYWLIVGNPGTSIEIYGIEQKTGVKVNGLPGVLYDQRGGMRTLAWIDEKQGYGFALRAEEDTVDLLAMAQSTAEGAPLKPTHSDKTLQALAELGDFSPGYLPEGFEEYAVAGYPLMEGSWYSYVRKWYVNREENKLIYFEYETYKLPNGAWAGSEAKTASAAFIPDYHRTNGQVPHKQIQVDGMLGLMTDRHAAWADPEKDRVFHLYSKDVSPEELLKVAQSIRENP
ncbi:MAG: hypothetical protein IJN53_07835 [Oscillospiraceae bacterium]|nr:hypothetical protein [Oscillospiraceae bacterium]